MKRLLCACVVVLFALQASPTSLGLEFRTNGDNSIALNIGIADQFELKPQLGFQLGDNAWMDLMLDGNFYLTDMGSLRHYAGFGINFTVVDNGNSNNNTSFLLGGHYGLRYDVNEIISLFGEIGIMMDFDPKFALVTTRPGIGCTFYLPAFN